jgi:hypothetical protein
MEIKINNKTYNYFMKRQHVGLFTKIIAKLIEAEKLEEFKNKNEIVLLLKIVKEGLLSWNNSDPDTLKFIASIYNVPEKEIEELGFLKEFKLWKHFFKDPDFKDFFSLVFSSIGARN